VTSDLKENFETLESSDQNEWMVEDVFESCGISKSGKAQTEMCTIINGS
jgi:hypothetical protein